MEDPVPCGLLHLRVDEEGRVAELCQLLCQEFDPGHGVAEDHRLIHVQLSKEGIETGNLLSLLHKRIVLCDTLEGQLFHEVHLVGVVEVAITKVFDGNGEGGGQQHNLSRSSHVRQHLLHQDREFGGEHLIRFIQDERRTVPEFRNALAGEVEDATRGGDDDMRRLHQSHNVIFEGGSSGTDDNLGTQVFRKGSSHLRRLQGQFTRRHQDERLHRVQGRVDTVQHGDKKGRRLSRPVFGSGQNISAS